MHMEQDVMAEAIDNPQVPEFASWRSYWRFEERVRRKRRHIWDQGIQDFLETILKTRRGRDLEIPTNEIFWRAQLGVEYCPLKDEDGIEIGEEPVGYSRERMKPRAEYAKEGRANSAGIPVLYLASTERTAISEVRPWVESDVSLAQFRITRELRAIDLSQGHGRSSWEGFTRRQLFGEEEPDADAKEKAVWIDIDNAFSRPVTLSDEKENYIPTRILAELFQEAGYDAIVYRSHFGQEERNGHNLAIFRLEDAEIINCTPCQVKSIEVEYSEIGNRWYSKSSRPGAT